MQLANAGHHVAVLARERAPLLNRLLSLTATATTTPKLLFAAPRPRSRWQPEYRVYRSRNVEAAMTDLIRRGSYDFAILQLDSHRQIDFHASVANRYVVYVRDAECIHDIDSGAFPEHVPLITNSVFVAGKLAAKTGRTVSTLIPYVERTRYATRSGGRFVTFVNPVPKKGLDLAIDIARACPEIQFLFVESWPQSRPAWRRLTDRVAAVPNVSLRRTVMDMRQVYAETRVLLVPSQWEESWARVVTESHFSGIPVLASDTGGLRESVGRGGVLLAPSEPADVWAAELRRLYEQSDVYREFSARAQEQAEAYWSKAQTLPGALLECCRRARREIR